MVSMITSVNLEHDEQKILNQLIMEYSRVRDINLKRSSYYEAKYGLKSLGISLPKELEGIDAVLGWPGLAVDKLAMRSNMQGFASPSDSDFGLDRIIYENDLSVVSAQAHQAAMIHAVSFAFVSAGDVQAGEPEVLVTVSDALHATGIWNPRTRSISAGLSITKVDAIGRVRACNMYLPGKNVHMEKLPSGKWSVTRIPTRSKHPRVVPIRHRPELSQPFGRPRINYPVMTYTDAALRTLVRSELAAEFFSVPQRYVLNVAKEAFSREDGTMQSQWESIMGRIWTLMKDPEDPDALEPKAGQFPAASQQPHVDQLRSFAQFFAAEASIPASSLGVLHDNPTSVDALAAMEREMVVLASNNNVVFGSAWQRVAKLALLVRDGKSDLPDEVNMLRPVWADPALPSKSATADAVMKLVSAGILPSDSDVVLEMLGFDRHTIERIQNHRLLAGPTGLDALAAAVASQNA